MSNRATYEIAGDDLLMDHEVIYESEKYLCELLLYNSGDNYKMGSVFLQNYYSVYDLDNFKMALGKTVTFGSSDPDPVDEPANSD